MRPGDVVVDRFEFEYEAGSGGMGTVFRATDRRAGEKVALKVLRYEDEDTRARFEREATLLAALEHPRIVRYIDHGIAADELYLAMEWLDGEDLARRLRRGPLSGVESVALAGSIADAPAAAPARRVGHRDVKPSNAFLVNGDLGAVKLLDFGIARTSAATRVRTGTGIALGTPSYMAPEQARGERTIDARADVFSLGCVLFECLTGRPAFAAEHA